MIVKAHAKLNLTLEVMGKRSDGYHEIASIMQTLDLADTVSVDHSDRLELTCSDSTLEGPHNLAWKAAELLRSEFRVTERARIHIDKNIPVAAGLGGGSSDAAATLVGLNRLWDLGLEDSELRRIGAAIGSDVPFLIEGGMAIAVGRGEQVRHLHGADLPWFVLAFPGTDIRDKTSTMYAALTPNDFTRGALTRKLEARIRGGGDVPPQYLFNAFDSVARSIVPEVDRCWNDLYAAGAREIHVTGSGPTVYAAVGRRELATTIQLVMEKIKGWPSLVARAWPNASTGR